jgi:hypothetical protein
MRQQADGCGVVNGQVVRSNVIELGENGALYTVLYTGNQKYLKSLCKSVGHGGEGSLGFRHSWRTKSLPVLGFLSACVLRRPACSAK